MSICFFNVHESDWCVPYNFSVIAFYIVDINDVQSTVTNINTSITSFQTACTGPPCPPHITVSSFTCLMLHYMCYLHLVLPSVRDIQRT